MKTMRLYLNVLHRRSTTAAVSVEQIINRILTESLKQTGSLMQFSVAQKLEFQHQTDNRESRQSTIFGYNEVKVLNLNTIYRNAEQVKSRTLTVTDII